MGAAAEAAVRTARADDAGRSASARRGARVLSASGRKTMAAATKSAQATMLSRCLRARRAAVIRFCSASSLGAATASSFTCCCRDLTSLSLRGACQLATA